MLTLEDDIYRLLLELGAIHPSKIEVFHNGTRDNPSLSIYRCKESEVIFLKDSRHVAIDYYTNKDGLEYWSAASREQALRKTFLDDKRRAALLKPLVAGKHWLDFGTGLGGILDMLKDEAKTCAAIEPQMDIKNTLINLGYDVYDDISGLDGVRELDVISLFHVLEHLPNSIRILKGLHSKLVKGGQIVVEVPHARDFLIAEANSAAFKKHTFWSEHLILHTKKSLRKLLEASGFTSISIHGIQRYPLNNHLYWLSKGKPGGHEIWDSLNSHELSVSYEKMLQENDLTDTLMAVAQKP